MVERLTSNYTDLKTCHKVREKSVLFTENLPNRWLLSAHAVNWYYQNSLFSCLVCTNSVNQLGEGQYKTVVSEGISFVNDFSYRTTKTLIFNPVSESKVVVNIFGCH